MISLLCVIGLHKWVRQFVGDADTPDAYVTACARCGMEKS